MSGTSLDGLDLALVDFNRQGATTSWALLKSKTFDIPKEIKSRISNPDILSKQEVKALDIDFGNFIGNSVLGWIKEENVEVDLIASHGHTLFHKPDQGLTFQAGNGNEIFRSTEIETVFDFRTRDVGLGGQGAPLVPVGERDLFTDYSCFINLGGIANISVHDMSGIKAWDLCPFNQVINSCAEVLGFAMDKGGEIGRTGTIDEQLLQLWNKLEYYLAEPPKSLGREWVEENFSIPQNEASVPDYLCSFYHHVTGIIAQEINKYSEGEPVFLSGGGAKNSLFIELLNERSKSELFIPDNDILDYKEAIIFAYLGFLRKIGEINILSSVTGSSMDHSAGKIIDK